MSGVPLFAIKRGMLKRSGIIALVVGVILTLINNGAQLFGEGSLPLKAVFNFLVPFVVSLTAQLIAGRDHAREMKAMKERHAAEMASVSALHQPDDTRPRG